MLILNGITTHAQENVCDCLSSFNETVNKTEANYAGFPTKVTSKTGAAYRSILNKLRIKATPEKRKKECFYIINEYVRFFKDKHFSFSYVHADDPDREFRNLSEKDLQNIQRGESKSVEGLWTNADSTLTLAIKKTVNNDYDAVVVSSKDSKFKKGLIYFTLRPNQNRFLLKQHHVFNSIDFYAKKRGNLLQLWNFELYGRVDATSEKEKLELSTWRKNNNGLDFNMLDNETAFIKIPTFFNNDSKIEKLVAANDKAIRSSKFLIIDLRGNGGGNAGWSFLLPYVMTNPIVQDAPLLRISEDNVKLKRSEMEYFVKNPVPPELKMYYTDAYTAMLKKAYEDLPNTKTEFYQIAGLTIPLNADLPNPSKVALIVDDLCGSSAEYFLYLMKQSKKTTSYGVNTVGMMDYEGPAVTTALPCNDFKLMIPVSKSSWTDKNAIDQTGFTPDVVLKMSEQEWLPVIRKHLKNQR